MSSIRTSFTPNPVWVGELDLLGPADSLLELEPTRSGHTFERARFLVLFGSEPVGMILTDTPGGKVDIEGVRREAARRFRETIDAAGGSRWSPDDRDFAGQSDLLQLEPDDLPGISVVIGTRNRPDKLIECVDRIIAQDYPADFEVIVVDNGASDNSTADALTSRYGHNDSIRYVAEPKPGLSRARNIGLAEARFTLTAFLSDDIRVHPMWMRAIARGFQREPGIWMVSGFCPPLYLDTEETLIFESSMAWGIRQGFAPLVYEFNMDSDPVHPYRAASFLNGSNMVYRTDEFRSIGGFDERLGPGSLARGGEDLDAPVRILAAGGKAGYEPAMFGWHADRYDDRAFERHMFSYGLGLTAFLTKHLLSSASRPELVRRIPFGFSMLWRAFGEPDRELASNHSAPLRLYLWHFAGRISGPFAYLRSRWALRHEPPALESAMNQHRREDLS